MSYKPQVLIIDDATFTRDLIKKTIRSDFSNCEIHEANDGKKAVSILKKLKKMDIILCDWEMPEMGGDEVLVWCREQPTFEKTPFVMVTSRDDKEDITAAVNLGVTDFLTKPFKSDQLVQKLTKAFKRCDKLTDAKGKKKSSVNSGLAADTTDILTTAFGGSHSTKTASSAKSAQKPVQKVAQPTPKDMERTSLQMADIKLDCLIEAINLKSIVLLSKRNDEIHTPLFGSGFIELALPNNSEVTEKINGYVSKLEAAEDKIDSKFIRIVISIIKTDQDHTAFLQKYLKAK